MKKVNLSWAGAVLVFALLLWCTAATPGTIADPSTYTCAVYSTALSLLPPVVAIVLALNTKEVYTSLLVGIATGALLFANGNLELALNTLFFNEDGGMVAKLSDSSNVGILVFLVMLGILVALMNKAGGSAAFGRWASTHIHTRAGAQFMTLVLGVLIFVDDYFNCLTVGSVMRPVTDRQKVSRAKLAYLIDATAAPVCIIAPVSSWAAAVTSSVPEGSGINGFTMFLRTIPYNYYALLTLIMILFLIFTGTDYGPMKLNEDNALKGDLFTTEDRPYGDDVDDGAAACGHVIDLILPVLVAVFGILSVYGRQGWLASLFHALGWQWEFSPYGLQGILLAHVFFNMPMATRLLLQALENIPGEQRQIAAQLGMRGYAFFRLVEWPWLRRHIPAVAALIFMLCFASFATVLSLGGGPKATTIELAIYQALSFDYDPARAAMLALIQMLCCLGLVLLSQRLSKAVAIGVSHVRGWRDPDDRLHSRLSDGLLIGAALLLLLPLLLAVIVDGINSNMLDVLAQPALWQALSTSLRIAIAAGLLSVTLTMMLLWSSRELRARQRPLAGQAMELSGMLILAMPGIVLATGFFLLLNNTIGLPESADGIVIFTNALMAIPYALKVLENPMRDIAARYSMLCQSLGIEGFARLRVVELRALRRPLAQALAFACVLSIGDFGVVALFGNEAFRTLPFYLYQQIGAYRSQDGAVTALLLLLLCFLLFTLIEKLPGRDAKTQ